MLRFLLRGILGCFVAQAAAAVPGAELPPADKPADKSGYTLWNPTPRALMREMNTDRPDRTESPYTVDAGHVQIEADVVSYAYGVENSGPGHTRVDAFAFAPLNFKVGLCNSADFQMVVPTYNSIYVRRSGTSHTDRISGFGDLVTRVKVNLWGNDGGDTAFAIMPFVRWPTSSAGVGNDNIEGGIILPLSVALPRGWTMGTMLEVDFNDDDDLISRHTAVINSITFSHSILGDLSGYVEFFSDLDTGSDAAPWRATADFGLTYQVTPDLQLDAGVNVGLTRASETLNTFLGISMRF